ncbi:MAG: tetratricopeptide repeat protein [Gemmatimonadetes bacterium]|nr:tetratricopeptide repeat protein [Gemmatimonadota bacterium]
MRLFTTLILAAILPLAAQAQTPLAVGDSLTKALKPAEALAWYQKSLAADSSSYEVLWKAGRAAADIAKQMEKGDSLYDVARRYAERAIRAHSAAPDGHFVLALALGRLARTKGGRDRVRYGQIIYDEAAKAIAIKPDHDGAHHILGAWHAEVERLSGITRFFAKAFFGGAFLSRANWDSSVVHLELAVAENPAYIYHHLELAEVLIDLKRYDEARQQLAAIAPLPPTSDVLDPGYKKRAATLLTTVRAAAP